MSPPRTTPLTKDEQRQKLKSLTSEISNAVMDTLSESMNTLEGRLTVRAASAIMLEVGHTINSFMQGTLLAIAYPKGDLTPTDYNKNELERIYSLIMLHRSDSSTWAETFFKARLDYEITYQKESPILCQILKNLPENPYDKH